MALTTVPSTARRCATALTVAALAVGLAACGSDDDADTTTAADATTTETAATSSTATEAPATTAEEEPTANGCETVEAPAPRTDEPDMPKPRPARLTGRWDVVFETSCGSFTVRLDTRRQPRTAASLASLAKARFYDGLTFHRIVTGFVIQGGDPTGSGSGDAGYSITERPPSDAAYTRGVVAMAKTADEAPGTSGSQFFVVSGEDAGLPPEYAIAGRVTRGLDVVERIGELGSGDQAGTPTQVVAIEHARLRRAG